MEEIVEEKNKKSKYKKVLMITLSIIAVILVISGTIILSMDSEQQRILEKEIKYISEIEIGKDNYNFKTEIKTTGNYAIVEETIKDYMQEYSNSVITLLNDIRANNNSTSVREKDKLEETREEIYKLREKVENDINVIIEITTEENIAKQIQKYNLSSKYVDLYNRLFEKYLLPELAEKNNFVVKFQERADEMLGVLEELYDYLVINEDKYIFDSESGNILFYNDNDSKVYMEIVFRLQTKVASVSILTK